MSRPKGLVGHVLAIGPRCAGRFLQVFRRVCYTHSEEAEVDMRKTLGRYIVADAAICHGKPTFRGTRIFVDDVLEQVAAGLAWETIIAEWNGAVSRPAIAEAVALAREAFVSQQRLARAS